MSQPSVFIGSSSEGLDFARAVRSQLIQDAEVSMWNEGFFSLGSTFIETLITQLPTFDFAILILTPDDLVSSRSVETFGPRDNVLFELGLFMGSLGRKRTFIVHQATPDLKIPSDLSGVTTATYQWPRTNHSHMDAVGAACDAIRNSIRQLGFAEIKTSKQLIKIESRQDTIESSVRLLQVVLKGLVTRFEYDKLRGLAADAPFMVKFHKRMYEELRRLDALGYVQPREGYGLHSITEMDGRGEEFDLKGFVQITKEGGVYLKFRQELSDLDDLPEDS